MISRQNAASWLFSFLHEDSEADVPIRRHLRARSFDFR